MNIVGAHPFADRFPMLPEDELQRLAEDIAENGLRQPVVVDADGRVLDGRNRLAACKLAGVEPLCVTYAPMGGADVAAFILSANVARRHQSTGSRAMSTALVLADSGKRRDGKWSYGAVSASNGENLRRSDWRKAMEQAGTIIDHAPDLAPAVVDGTLALDAAYRQAEQRRDAERQALADQERIVAEETDARTRLEDIAPEYLTKYETARQALAAWEDHNREAAARARRERAEQERREAEAKRAATHTYSKIAENLLGLGSFGEYDDPFLIMADFDTSLLNPPQLDRAFALNNLYRARKFLDALIGWKESE